MLDDDIVGSKISTFGPKLGAPDEGAALGVLVGAGLGVGVGACVAAFVGVAVGAGVADGDAVGDALELGVAVACDAGVAVGSAVGGAVAVGVEPAGLAVGSGVEGGIGPPPPEQAASARAKQSHGRTVFMVRQSPQRKDRFERFLVESFFISRGNGLGLTIVDSKR
jgi:hypothetical protein